MYDMEKYVGVRYQWTMSVDMDNILIDMDVPPVNLQRADNSIQKTQNFGMHRNMSQDVSYGRYGFIWTIPIHI